MNGTSPLGAKKGVPTFFMFVYFSGGTLFKGPFVVSSWAPMLKRFMRLNVNPGFLNLSVILIGGCPLLLGIQTTFGGNTPQQKHGTGLDMSCVNTRATSPAAHHLLVYLLPMRLGAALAAFAGLAGLAGAFGAKQTSLGWN